MVPTDLCPVGFVKFPATIPSSSACLVCSILVVAPRGGEQPLPILSLGKLQQACPISITVGPSIFFTSLLAFPSLGPEYQPHEDGTLPAMFRTPSLVPRTAPTPSSGSVSSVEFVQ